ncbi:NUDIX hydrolase [Basilea psittacipulmonis]|uniref:Nudix hydrolase domain-containing protein n=1 Tax=Basilea psittacipulmonis DSM 24701 TaxID=1072685 RepID=A0A077DJS1_9BURK|nr:NUDIX domain-containing protein [Basilea psittacipulmonis]AIL33338.1 hypothetical protein IX83_08525 [Basilea psittacipulmonis DSM 24701]
MLLQDLFTKIYFEFQSLPTSNSKTLLFQGRPIGNITEQASQALCQANLARDQSTQLHLDYKNPHIWDEVALCLKEAHLLRGWRNEKVDIWDKEQSIGAIERTATRPLGLRTQAVHLHAITRSGYIWLGQRALTKSTDPGKWDTTAGGLVSYGESVKQALYRESWEEAGLPQNRIRQIGPVYNICRVHRRLPEGFQVEDMLVMKCFLADGVVPTNQDGEVSCFKAYTQNEVVQLIEAGQVSNEAALILLHDFLNEKHDRFLR